MWLKEVEGGRSDLNLAEAHLYLLDVYETKLIKAICYVLLHIRPYDSLA
jgi:hypothetical protein